MWVKLVETACHDMVKPMEEIRMQGNKQLPKLYYAGVREQLVLL
jgi:hypothetical protein